MNPIRYLIIDKKDDVYLKIEADESIRRELGEHFTFQQKVSILGSYGFKEITSTTRF